MKLAVILVNLNTRDLLAQALEALAAQQADVSWEAWVVDNGSHDGSVAMLEARFPEVRVIANAENLGYAAANNQALRAAQADFYMLLNTDTKMLPGALAAMMDALDCDPRLGLLGAKLLNADGTPQPSCAPDRFPYAFSSPETACAARWVSGACMIIRKQALDEIGLLDEAFFYTGEDCDWGTRARRKGWKVAFTPRAEVIHYGGATRDSLPRRAKEALHIGRHHYFTKHHGIPGRLYANLHSLIELTGDTLRAFRREERQEASKSARFHLDLLKQCWSYRPRFEDGR